MEQYTSEYGTNIESLRQLTDAAQLRDVMQVVMRAHSRIQYKMARKYSEEIGVRHNKRPLHEIVQTEEDVSLRYGLYPPQEAIAPLDVDNETLIQEALQGIILPVKPIQH